MLICEWSSDVVSSYLCGSGVGVWMSLPARRELVCRGRGGLFVGKAGPSPGAARLPLPLRRRGAARSLEARCFSPSRSEEHTSELQSLMRISYAVFCLKKTNILPTPTHDEDTYTNLTLHAIVRTDTHDH